ncbi:threonine synthase [Thermococcus thioreducens]|uniref:Threonine synthase n=1 Tax=Thermococcus thioreducens TaxID=277988 RepID=A0A0Q2M612_9EURY|nr:threonine synthase [Thermococcus thioreducens]KQH83346.1 threonine synthase [Thermococcus thioreducens]SEW21385.1 threonine synthase [Thermococcus thioreducens]
MKLVCPICGKTYEEPVQRCECGEPVEFETFKGEPYIGKSVWERFWDFWPVEPALELSLGEGDTPLIRSKLGKELGVKLYLKNETANPTWSFKDRGTFLAMSYAVKVGYKAVGTVSTGNMAASVSAYASRFGLKAKILVSESASDEKLKAVSVYGGEVIRVRGDYGRLYFDSMKLGKRLGVYFMNSDNPFRVEGYKGIAFEIAEEISPDYVLIPTSSGGLFRGVAKGFIELHESGLIDRVPTLIAVQAEGCSPICRAFREGKIRIERFENPKTIAKAIANPYPPSGNAVLKLLREFGWKCVSVSDDKILEAQRKLAGEGLFVQPASATGIAALKKLELPEGAKVVSILTGSGLKTLSTTGQGKVRECHLERLENCIKNDS